MAEAGVLQEDDRVELVEGEIIQMSPIGKVHAAFVNRLARLFQLRLVSRAVVSIQNPVRLGQHSEPQPDVALLRPRADDYAGALPGPADALLVVEVADTSQAYDRDVKILLYAQSGIPEAWLLDAGTQILSVCREPAAAGYRAVSTFRTGQSVAPVAFPDLVIPLEDLFRDIP